MGGKRGNDNAQLSREEYEDLQRRESDSGLGGQVFQRASEETMAKRRVVRSRRPKSTSPKPSVAAGSAGGGSGIFANINFGTPSSKPAIRPPVNKPTFALPTASSSSTVPAFATIAEKTVPASSTKSTTKSPRQELFAKFKEYVQGSTLRKTYTLATTKYICTAISLEADDIDSSVANVNSTTNTSTSKNGPPSDTISTSPAAVPKQFPVGSQNGASTQPASKTPAPFSFGTQPAGNSAASASSSSTTPSFSFGSKVSTTSSSPAAGSAPSFSFGTGAASAPATTSGFSFAPTSAVPAPGGNIKISMSPVPAQNSTTDAGTSAGANTVEEAPEALASADGDWNQLMSTSVAVYHYRKGGSATKFASGNLKIQESKDGEKKRRMVLRDAAGKVLVNVGINKGMTFVKSSPAGKTKRKQWTIHFVGIMDIDRGAEKFTLKCREDAIESLHKKLTELAG